MKFAFLIAFFISCFVNGFAQLYSEFPGTGFGLVLPDSTFKFMSRGFGSNKYGASILFTNTETDPDLSNTPLKQMMESFRKTAFVPGTTLLLDETTGVDSSRLWKLRVIDSTGERQGSKDNGGIMWVYFSQYKGSATMIAGSYDNKYDALLSNLYYRSFKTFKAVDTAQANRFFPNRISITNDYAPLKYCCSVMGGILLNMAGTFLVTGGDSSYFLVVPMNLKFPSTDPKAMRSYLKRRLEIQTKTDIRILSSGTDSKEGFRSYSMVARTYHGKLLYICIKSDDKGYFEIWGEAYGGNPELMDIFKRIADSLKRN